MKRKQIICILASSFVFCVMVIIPTLYGYKLAPSGYLYTGVRDFAPADTFVYYSYLEQIKQGSTTLEDLYTTEYGTPVFNILWYLTGTLATVTGIQYVWFLVLVRFVFAALFFYVLYMVVECFSKSEHDVMAQYLLILLFGGIGAYLHLLAQNVKVKQLLDLSAIEHNILLSIASSPHLILSTMLVLTTLFLGFLSMSKKSVPHAISAGMCGLVLFQFHPYYAPLVYVVLGIYFVVIQIQNRHIAWGMFARTLLPLIVLSSITLVPHMQLIISDEIYIVRSISNVDRFESILGFLGSFSFFLPAALFGIYRIVREKAYSQKNLFLITWFAVQGFLILLPISYQRKFLEAWSVPMVLLAWPGLVYIGNRLRERISYITLVMCTIICLVLLTPTTYLNMVRTFIFYNDTDNEAYQADIIFISPERQDAYMWLRQHTDNNAVILSSINSGMVIPAYTGRRVYAGHWSETLLIHEEKAPNVFIYFDARTKEEWRKRFMQRNGITYVWYGMLEQEATYDPSSSDNLTLVYANSEIRIYKVL